MHIIQTPDAFYSSILKASRVSALSNITKFYVNEVNNKGLYYGSQASRDLDAAYEVVEPYANLLASHVNEETHAIYLVPPAEILSQKSDIQRQWIFAAQLCALAGLRRSLQNREPFQKDNFRIFQTHLLQQSILKPHYDFDQARMVGCPGQLFEVPMPMFNNALLCFAGLDIQYRSASEGFIETAVYNNSVREAVCIEPHGMLLILQDGTTKHAAEVSGNIDNVQRRILSHAAFCFPSTRV